MRIQLGLMALSLLVGGCGGGGSSADTSTSTGTGSSSTGSSGTGSTGGGTGGSTGGTSSTAPKLVQTSIFQTPNAEFATNTSVQFSSATKAGDTIWVAVTVSDSQGAHTIAISDTQGNSYKLLDQVNDGAPGTQSVAHFYATDIAGDGTTPDTITATWSYDNYKGMVIAEISGATSASLVGHASNDQDGLAAGTNNVTAGPVDVSSAQTPALVLALSMNTFGGTSDTGGSGATGPAAGSGMTLVSTFWDWGGNLGTLATQTVSGAESASSVFSASGSGSYVTVTAAFH